MRMGKILASLLLAFLFLLSLSIFISAQNQPPEGETTTPPPPDLPTRTPTPWASPAPWPSPTPWPTPTPYGSIPAPCAGCGPIETIAGSAYCATRTGTLTETPGTFIAFGCSSSFSGPFSLAPEWSVSHCPYGLWDCPDCPPSCRCSHYEYSTDPNYPRAEATIYNGFEGPASSILELRAIISIPQGCESVDYTPWAFEGGKLRQGFWIDCYDTPCSGSPCFGKGAGIFYAGCPGGHNCPRGSGRHEIIFRFGANFYTGSCDDSCPSSAGGGIAWVDVICSSGPLSGTQLYHSGGSCGASQYIWFGDIISRPIIIGISDEDPRSLHASFGVSPSHLFIGDSFSVLSQSMPYFEYLSLLPPGDSWEMFVPCSHSLSLPPTFGGLITVTIPFSDCHLLIPPFSLPDLPGGGSEAFDFPGLEVCLEFHRISIYLFPIGDIWTIIDRLLLASVLLLAFVLFWQFLR